MSLEYDGPEPGHPFEGNAGWFIEEGIGETRALLIGETGEIEGMRLHWPGEILAGEIVQAKKLDIIAANRGFFRTDTGLDILVDKLPGVTEEGRYYPIQIHRVPIAERGRLKPAQGRLVVEGNKASISPRSIFPQGKVVRRFPAGLWEDHWQAASAGKGIFSGGELLFSVTPAMTLIDIDFDDPRGGVYGLMAAADEIALMIKGFDLGGNIGIDFPTLQSKSDRKMLDEELERHLRGWPHERTAMNGFGFVQLVARLERPSLLHRFATSRTALCARYALRMAERVDGPGITLLTVHPALKAKFKLEWLDELRRRTGRDVRIETNPGLALETPNAQNVRA